MACTKIPFGPHSFFFFFFSLLFVSLLAVHISSLVDRTPQSHPFSPKSLQLPYFSPTSSLFKLPLSQEIRMTYFLHTKILVDWFLLTLLSQIPPSPEALITTAGIHHRETIPPLFPATGNFRSHRKRVFRRSCEWKCKSILHAQLFLFSTL